jgi:(p)ppGpp synthase/HD superfamily hydrolase
VSDVLLLARAWHFSAERHVRQRRKGEAQEPYVNHLAEVAEMVATATEGRDANLVAAAVLHDTVEDTATQLAELASVFNADIADLVAEVTDDKRLGKEERKRRQVAADAVLGGTFGTRISSVAVAVGSASRPIPPTNPCIPIRHDGSMGLR